MVKLRGDITMQIGREKIILVPSFLNLMQIEERLAPDNLYTLADKIGHAKITAKELVNILYCGTGRYDEQTQEWSSKWEFMEFGELLLKHEGVAELMAPAMQFIETLFASMKEDKEPKKETAKPAKKTTSRSRSTGKSSPKSRSAASDTQRLSSTG